MGFAPSDTQIADFVSFTGAQQQDAVNYLTVSLLRVLPRPSNRTDYIDSESQTLKKPSRTIMTLRSVEQQGCHL